MAGMGDRITVFLADDNVIVREGVRAMPAGRSCKCGAALAHAIVTSPSAIPAPARKRLQVIAGKYLTPGAR